MASYAGSKALTASRTAFEVSMGEATWGSAVAELVSASNAAGGVIFDINRATGIIDNWHSVGLDHSTRYQDEMNAINPRMHYSMAQTETHVLTDLHVLPMEALKRHDFYRWLENENRLQFFLGGRILDDGDVSTFLSVEFENGIAPPGKVEFGRFAELAKQFASARRWEKSSGTTSDGESVDDFLARQSNTGLLFLDENGRFLFANPAGERMLSNQSTIRLSSNKPTLIDHADNKILQMQFAALQKLGKNGGILNFPAISLPFSRTEGQRLLRLMRMQRPLSGSGGKWASACLFIQYGAVHETEGAGILQATFSLTLREAELALAFCRLHSIALAAEELGMAKNTARVHMQNVLRKMDIRSQTQLVEIIQRFSAWQTH